MPPVYDNTDLATRFGTHRRVLERLYYSLSVRSEFIRKFEDVGNSKIHALQRITGALRVLPYGHSYDAVDEVVEAPETSMAKTLKTFCEAVLEVFRDEYLCEPGEEDLRLVLSINE